MKWRHSIQRERFHDANGGRDAVLRMSSNPVGSISSKVEKAVAHEAFKFLIVPYRRLNHLRYQATDNGWLSTSTGLLKAPIEISSSNAYAYTSPFFVVPTFSRSHPLRVSIVLGSARLFGRTWREALREILACTSFCR